jgi:hypothetical protein
MTIHTPTSRQRPKPDRFARVRERELLDVALDEAMDDVASFLDEEEDCKGNPAPVGPDDVVDIVADVRAALKKAIANLCELRERNGGGAP